MSYQLINGAGRGTVQTWVNRPAPKRVEAVFVRECLSPSALARQQKAVARKGPARRRGRSEK